MKVGPPLSLKIQSFPSATVRSFGFPDKIDDTHLIFLKIAIPLVVFYRFHCSICFAEVWNVFYHIQPIQISIPTTPQVSRAIPETPNSARHLLTPDSPDVLELDGNGYEVPISRIS